MNKKIIAVSFFIIGCIGASDFVVKKKKSVAVRKEQCCEQMAELLKTFPDILRLIAEIQEEEFKVLCDFFEGQKRGLLHVANGQELQELSVRIEKVRQDMLTTRQSLADFVRYTRQVGKKTT